MNYQNKLQLTFSGKEFAMQRIAIIESTNFNDEVAERFGRERREKYQSL